MSFKSHDFTGLICCTAAWFCGATVFVILATMIYLAWPLLVNGQFFSILSGGWDPRNGVYGIYPMFHTSIVLSFLALIISLPICFSVTIVANVLAPPFCRKILKNLIQLMAAIPTVVYGFVAIFLLVPIMRGYITMGSGLSIITAATVLAFLIAPTMIVMFSGGFASVPAKQLLALDALGVNPIQKVLYLLVPQTMPTIISGIILGFGRAMGDTLISLMLAGNAPVIAGSIADSGRTLTAHIGLVIAADFDSLEFKSVFACGMVLYFLTTIFIVVVRKLSNSSSSIISSSYKVSS